MSNRPNRKATDEQVIDALKKHGGNISAAARELGLHRTTLAERAPLLARKGFSPDHGLTVPYPDGYYMGKVTIQRDGAGTILQTWERMCEDKARMMEIMREAVMAMAQELPQLEPRVASGTYLDDLLTAYPIGDPHIGMLAWGTETGKDWDLDIATRVHLGAMKSLVASAIPTKQALIVNLGDLFHYDSLAPVTPRSGHHLDSDGRYAKMVNVGVKIMRQNIESALEKHEFVHVINAPGNHDETGALWLSILLAHVYANEPRVTIDTDPGVFAYFRWGKCLIGIHHGHTCKPDKLPGVMAADRAKDWGETEYRYWWMGHIHHESKKEFPGVSVESFNTLASTDAYAKSGGWRSRETMQSITLHRDWGIVARSQVNADMFR